MKKKTKFAQLSKLQGVDSDDMKYQRWKKFVSQHNMAIAMYLGKQRIFHNVNHSIHLPYRTSPHNKNIYEYIY